MMDRKLIFSKNSLLWLFVGLITGWFLSYLHLSDSSFLRGNILRLDKNNTYKFIDPILACDTGAEELFPEFKPIKSSLQNYINDEVRNGNVRDVSIYLRSMKAGRWFVINGQEKYAPASLLKIFIMVAYYREFEEKKEVLDKEVIFYRNNDSEKESSFEMESDLIGGKYYSIGSLIEQMIIYSDNDAMNILIDNFDDKTIEAINSIFSDLNILKPSTSNEKDMDFMSVDSYAMIFRVLFGGTYLSRENSEKALSLLSKSQYKEGIAALISKDISVAHKFGVRTVAGQEGTYHELHDCGIVYYPDHPYLLCVMTRGDDLSKLQKSIQDISKISYNKLNSFFLQLTK